mgnify:CR=1 FL=1
MTAEAEARSKLDKVRLVSKICRKYEVKELCTTISTRVAGGESECNELTMKLERLRDELAEIEGQASAVDVDREEEIEGEKIADIIAAFAEEENDDSPADRQESTDKPKEQDVVATEASDPRMLATAEPEPVE